MEQRVILDGLSMSELLNSFRAVVKEELMQQQPDRPVESTDKLTRKQAREKLQVSYPTLRSLVKSGKLSMFKIGKKVYFDPKDVEAVYKKINLAA